VRKWVKKAAESSAGHTQVSHRAENPDGKGQAEARRMDGWMGRKWNYL
jgi:hypothetical protein